MKVLRSLGCVLCCIVLCVGVGFLSLQAIMEKVLSEQVIASSTQTIIKEVLSSSIVDAVEIPAEQKAQVEQIQKQIAKDENIEEITQEVMGAILSQDQQLGDIESQLEDVITTYAPQMAQAAGVDISTQQIQTVMNEKLNDIDVQKVLQENIDQVKSKLPSGSTKALDGLYQLQSLSLNFIAYGCMIGAMIGIVLLCFHPWKWLGYVAGSGIVGGGLMMVFGKVIPSFLPSRLTDIDMVNEMVKGASSIVFQYGMIYFVVAVLALVAYLLAHFVHQRSASSYSY